MIKRTCWVDGCEESRVKWGMCPEHRKDWLTFFPRRESKMFGVSLEERFWSYVQKGVSEDVCGKFGAKADCWVWTGALDDGGYGIIGVDGSSKRTHVLSWQISGKDALEGFHRDHLCRFRPCCNPEHLEQITHQDNVLRGVGLAAENARKSHCPEGHLLDGPNLLIEELDESGRVREKRRCRTCVNALAARGHAARREGQTDRRRSDDACRKGHPRTEENTVMRGDKRRCKVCLREAANAEYARRTEEQKEARRLAAEPVSGVRGSGQFRKALTHCPKGHPYDGDNLFTVWRTAKDGEKREVRRCRACQREANHASYVKRRDQEQ